MRAAPTQTIPGTESRLAVLAARAEAGLPLFVEGDLCLPPPGAEGRATSRGSLRALRHKTGMYWHALRHLVEHGGDMTYGE